MSKLSEEMTGQKAFGWAARDASGILFPFSFSRRATGPDDVTIKILFCGVCHSDLNVAKNEWQFTCYPMVPGHEIVGLVTKTGINVKKFRIGDSVGVGVIIDSCKSCEICEQNLENYCEKVVFTYNSMDEHRATMTYGGFSNIIVVNQNFVLKFPKNLPLNTGAPLLCAGITVYSSMKYYGITQNSGKHLGIAGLGGLGHIAVKLAKAFELKVTVIDISPEKEDEAIHKFGADSFLLSSDLEKMKAAVSTMDFIIDTIPVVHSLAPLIDLLKLNGKLITLGLPEKPLELPIFPLVLGRKLVGGSSIGGIKETQEMLDFCAEHNITAEIELIGMDEINIAMERLAKSDVKYRFVVEIARSVPILSPNFSD